MKPSKLTIAALTIAVFALALGALGTALAISVLTQTDSTSELQTAEFTHAEMTPSQITFVKSDLPNSSVGDKRYYYVPATSPAGGVFTGSLTVMTQNAPAPGKELRETSLIFQMGNINDQIQIGGVAVYDSANPALVPGDVITRPIIGGIGKYAGATGYANTTHNADGSWKHVFHFTTLTGPRAAYPLAPAK